MYIKLNSLSSVSSQWVYLCKSAHVEFRLLCLEFFFHQIINFRTRKITQKFISIIKRVKEEKENI